MISRNSVQALLAGVTPKLEVRIFGPPGTGKTTTMTRVITDACQQYGSEAVLVCSFTRSAAKELVSRNLPLDNQQVGTLHAICYRALGRPTLSTERTQLKEWNRLHPYYRMAGGMSADELDDPYGRHDVDGSGQADGDPFLQQANRLRGLMVSRQDWPIRVQDFFEDWVQFKDMRSLVDFTDLIELCIREQVPIPNGARALFLDEVQDFSPLELAVARMWGSQCDLFYIAGDDDQCLYSFKGATPDAFLFPELPHEQILVLGQSYRVPKAVHEVASRISSQIVTRKLKAYLPRDFDGDVGYLRNVTYRYPERLRPLLDNWQQAGKTIAILASCSYMLDTIKTRLRDWGMPFHNPYRAGRADWNPLRPARGETVSPGDRVEAYLKLHRGQLWTYHDLYVWAQELKTDRVLEHGAKTAMRMKALDEMWKFQQVDPVNLSQWIIDPDAPAAAMNGDLNWYERRILGSRARAMKFAIRVAVTYGPEKLESIPQIILGTVHSVKGGEADIVVFFPDLSRSANAEYTTPGDPRDSILRMAYVAVTRAKEAVYVTQPFASAFLKIIL